MLFRSVSQSRYLPENYHIHICGFGTDEDTKQVKELIATASKKTKAMVTYDGLKKGREFIEFLQRCHIGLSTQKPEGSYNDTSFPSKVLTYIANGLSVVSVRLPVLEASSIQDATSFFDIAKGNSLAKAIQNVESKDNHKMIQQLDNNFKNTIKNIL